MLKGRSQFIAQVLANQPLCRDHYRLTLRLPGFPKTAPGQFVQIACRTWNLDYSVENEIQWQAGDKVPLAGLELQSPLSLLRKPFSLAARRDVRDGVELDIIHRTVGTGTSWMSSLKAGGQVNLIGPLGNSFPMPGEEQVAIMVGGGVGIPPMVYFASVLAGRAGGRGAKGVVFAGSLCRDLLPLTVTADAPIPAVDSHEPLYNIEEFARHGVPAVVCTDDGSWGFRGLVTQALERYLDAYFAKCPQKAVVYTCGPEAMMRRVAEIAERRSVQCYVSVERAMACGMGTCQSCVIKVKNELPALPDRQWVYKLACTDGPIFYSRKLLW
jgi:dihydroorotate dehydrogenase electron transfer subunit